MGGLNAGESGGDMRNDRNRKLTTKRRKGAAQPGNLRFGLKRKRAGSWAREDELRGAAMSENFAQPRGQLSVSRSRRESGKVS